MSTGSSFDVVIAGGGPAGLSAALVLGRARRRVLLCDTDRPRNAVSRSVNGFLSRDGMDPAELRATARGPLAPYDGGALRHCAVTDAARSADGFRITLGDGSAVAARKLLLAYGLVDALPDIP